MYLCFITVLLGTSLICSRKADRSLLKLRYWYICSPKLFCRLHILAQKNNSPVSPATYLHQSSTKRVHSNGPAISTITFKSIKAKYLFFPASKKVLLWFSLAGHQVPTKAALSLPLLSRTGERNYKERLVGRDKDREKSFASYCQGQKRWLGETDFIYFQPNKNRIIRNKN